MSNSSLSFSHSQIIKQSWQIIQQKWAFLLGVWLIAIIISVVSRGVVMGLSEYSEVLAGVGSLGVQIVAILLSIGMIKVILKVVRGEESSLSELTQGSPYLVQYFLLSLVLGLMVMVGLVLLIVPGIIWAIQYMFAPTLLIDEKLSFSEAMAKSAKMTDGLKLKLFVFGLILCGLNVLGMIPLFLGLFITIPITGVAQYVLYVELKKQFDAKNPV